MAGHAPPSAPAVQAPLAAIEEALAKLIPGIGLVLSPVKSLHDSFTQLGKALGNLATTALTQVTNVFKGLTQTLAAIFPPLQKLGSVFESLGKFGIALGNLFTNNAVGRGLVAFKDRVANLFEGRAAQGIGNYLGGMGKAIGSLIGVVGGAIGSLAGACGAVVGAIVAVVGAMVAVGAAVVGIGEVMAIFVGKANPALVQLFTNAVDDLLAVIGQALAPTFVVVTALVRLMADGLMSWLPTLGAVVGMIFESLMPAFQVVSDVVGRMGQVILAMANAAMPAILAVTVLFSEMMQQMEPVFTEIVQIIGGAFVSVVKGLSEVFLAVMPFILAFGKVFLDVVSWITHGISMLFALLGVDLGGGVATTAPTRGGSVGAAAKGTSIGSIESVLQTAQKSAFAIGLGATTVEKPEIRTAGAAEALKKRADEIYNYIQKIPEKLKVFFKELPAEMWKFIAHLPVVIWDNVKVLADALWEIMKKLPDEFVRLWDGLVEKLKKAISLI